MRSPEPLVGQTPVRWCIGFVDVPTGSGIVRRALGRLAPGYRHVCAFRGVPEGLLFIQPTVGRVQVEFFPGETEDARRRLIVDGGGSVVEAVAFPNDSQWTFRLFTCVCLARALLGMPMRVQTPWSLARTLRSRQGSC